VRCVCEIVKIFHFLLISLFKYFKDDSEACQKYLNLCFGLFRHPMGIFFKSQVGSKNILCFLLFYPHELGHNYLNSFGITKKYKLCNQWKTDINRRFRK